MKQYPIEKQKYKLLQKVFYIDNDEIKSGEIIEIRFNDFRGYVNEYRKPHTSYYSYYFKGDRRAFYSEDLFKSLKKAKKYISFKENKDE